MIGGYIFSPVRGLIQDMAIFCTWFTIFVVCNSFIHDFLSFADLQKSLVARQQLDSQLSENKLVLDVCGRHVLFTFSCFLGYRVDISMIW